MKNKNLYKILGVSENASDKDIKSAYRKLALRYHPDRQGNKSETEKKKAEEKFKEISEAYSILSNPEKRRYYDTYGTIDPNQMNDGFDGADLSEMFKHMSGMFDIPGFGFGGFGHKQGPTNGESIRLQINISIEDAMNGIKNKKIMYTRKVRCKHCHGAGGEDVTICPHCNGTGMITETQRHGFSIIQNSHPCQYCGGTGKIIKNVCNKCNGTGFVEVKEEVTLNINHGINDNEAIRYGGYGNESKDPNGKTGDLVVVCNYAFDTSKYAISGNDIYELISIDYYNCILGCEFEYTLPSKDKVVIKIPEYTQDKAQIRIPHKGINNNGDYIFVVSVRLPKYISKEDRKNLEKIQKEHK